MPLVFRLSTPFARCALLVLAVSAVPVGRQAARAEIPPSDASFATAERVFVSGVPDTFEKVRAAIEKATQESGRDYRVIVVGNAGGERNASTRLLESLIERWQEEEARGTTGQPGGFDSARDLTIVLDVSPEVGLSRLSNPDRLEAEPLAYHETVRAAFLTIAAQDPDRYLVLDALRDVDALAAAILERVTADLAAV